LEKYQALISSTTPKEKNSKNGCEISKNLKSCENSSSILPESTSKTHHLSEKFHKKVRSEHDHTLGNLPLLKTRHYRHQKTTTLPSIKDQIYSSPKIPHFFDEKVRKGGLLEQESISMKKNQSYQLYPLSDEINLALKK